MSRRRFLIAGATLAAGAAAFGVYRFGRRERGHPPNVPKGGDFNGPFLNLPEVVDNADFDVCVLGSGPAGTFLASELARKGVRVLLAEAGHKQSIMAREAGYSRLVGHRSSGTLDYPLSQTHLMAPGGTTGVWNGRCPRLLSVDFEPNSYTPAGMDWPFRYSDIEPYYARAEASLRVTGDPQGSGVDPRSTPLPAPPVPFAAKAPIRAVMDRAGLHYVQAPTSTSPQDPAEPVRVGRDILPAVASQPSVTLVLGATGHRFELDVEGKVTHLELRDVTGNRRRVRARAFVIAGGATETARRLLLNRSERWPDGIGNRQGLVGAGFSEHTGLHFMGRYRTDPPGDLPEKGAFQRIRSFDHYTAFKKAGLGGVMLHAGLWPDEDSSTRKQAVYKFSMIAELELEYSPGNRIRLAQQSDLVDALGDPFPDLSFSFTARDLATQERARAVVRDIYSRVGASDFSEKPGPSWGHHHLGTTRMGKDPATSVVDPNLRVHGTKNLFVASSSVFVTGGAVNPTLTIVALSHRLSDHLIGALGNGELPPVAAVGSA